MWLRERRRRRLLAEPFPAHWDAILDEIAVVRHLRPDARQKLRDLVSVFIAEKHWEGCGGLDLTDEIKVTIAAQACRLVLGRVDELYDDVASILVYPSTVIVPPHRPRMFEQAIMPVAHGGTTVLGQAMLGGPVVLAWDSVEAGALGQAHGNVTLHEFAHKLDMANGRIDGTPPLATRAERERWARVCSAAFERHRTLVDSGWPTMLDPYGATNEAEFFAVATEAYFTRGWELELEHPELYALLADFYRIP
jgi:Mlc titration factor MtfA (ptsG expression regulator)